MKEKELKIARDNVSALMQEKFVFNPERFLNKTVLFWHLKSWWGTNHNRILKNICDNKDDVCPIHEPSTNPFSLRRKEGT